MRSKTLSIEETSKLKNSMRPVKGCQIQLRLIMKKDLRTTLEWRNSEDIRSNFFNSDIIEWKRHLDWWGAYKHKSDDFVFIIEKIGCPNVPLGQVSLYNINFQRGEAEYGRLMIGAAGSRRLGYASDASVLLLLWGFDTLKLERIYLQVFKFNDAAISLYKKCGFKKKSEDAARGLDIMEITSSSVLLANWRKSFAFWQFS
jgi:RimJ/RimL family protein N-acetyltransferase